MQNIYMPERGSRRNDFTQHHQPLPPAELTPAGRIIWLRTHRPVATCNLLGELAGFAGRAA